MISRLSFWISSPTITNMRLIRRNAGHTLLELVVVLVVVGILGGASLALYRNYSGVADRVKIMSGLDVITAGQQAFVQRNPTLSYNSITTSNILSYLPNSQIPTELAGCTLTVNVRPATAVKNGITYTAAQ